MPSAELKLAYSSEQICGYHHQGAGYPFLQDRKVTCRHARVRCGRGMYHSLLLSPGKAIACQLTLLRMQPHKRRWFCLYPSRDLLQFDMFAFAALGFLACVVYWWAKPPCEARHVGEMITRLCGLLKKIIPDSDHTRLDPQAGIVFLFVFDDVAYSGSFCPRLRTRRSSSPEARTLSVFGQSRSGCSRDT